MEATEEEPDARAVSCDSSGAWPVKVGLDGFGVRCAAFGVWVLAGLELAEVLVDAVRDKPHQPRLERERLNEGLRERRWTVALPY